MMRQNKFTGRVAALAILATVIGAGWLLVGQPLIGALTGGNDQRAQAMQLLARYDALIAQSEMIGRQRQELGATATQQTGLISGPTAAVAAATLQGELKALIEGLGGEIRSAQVLPPETVEGFERIAIQYELNLPISALQRLLQALEGHRTVLLVDSLRLRVPETIRTPQPNAQPPKINGQWVIAAFRQDANAP